MVYVKPIAKSGVYFTKNLTEGNYNNGVILLGVFWRASVLSKAPYYPITNFDGLLNFYKVNYPTFIEYLGTLYNTYGSDKANKIMQAVADKKFTYYPRPSDFSNAMIKLYGQGVSVLQVASETASDIGNSIISFSQWYVY